MNIEQLIREMTVEEKAALIAGTDFMYTNPIPRLGIPSLCVSDGPHGLRKQIGGGDNGISQSEPATAFPTASLTACGWNPDNLRRMGAAIGRECRHYGVHTLLGPGVNIQRNPLCGRNFEYFSEDPLLSGIMGAAEAEGVQSQGVGVSVKHFAMNNSENYRFMGDSIASEKTIRALYLKPFEYIVKHARPATVMCAYNRVNGVFCSENKWLLTDVLRGEWGFDGVVMSDWGAVRDRVAGVKAGLDLEMPGDTAVCRRRVLDAVADGSLPMEDLDSACRSILRWIDAYVKPADPTPVDWDAHHALSAEIAADCAVLLKNDGALPLSAGDRLHIAGGHAPAGGPAAPDRKAVRYRQKSGGGAVRRLARGAALLRPGERHPVHGPARAERRRGRGAAVRGRHTGGLPEGVFEARRKRDGDDRGRTGGSGRLFRYIRGAAAAARLSADA